MPATATPLAGYAYTLTLSLVEREAIDWVGHRYSHGNDLFDILMECHFEGDWDAPYDITFHFPEYLAWRVLTVQEENEDRWDCLSTQMAGKLRDFCFHIV